MVLAVLKEAFESWDPEATEEIEWDFGSVTDCDMKESQCMRGSCCSETAPDAYVTDGSRSEAPS